MPSTVENWEIPDPRRLPIDQVRAIRDDVERRVRDLIDNRLDEIRSDHTAHRLRLERIIPGLIEEFHASRSDEEIRACTDAVLQKYRDAPVRSFILTLAQREARECLRKEHCDLLIAGGAGLPAGRPVSALRSAC